MLTDKTREGLESIPFQTDVPYEDREYHLKKKEFDPPKPKFEDPDKIQSPFIGVDEW